MTAEFDPATPNIARVYDYWLGGKDNYPADCAEAQRLLGIYPPLRELVRENRAFVTHAVSWAARQGIGRFIDHQRRGNRRRGGPARTRGGAGGPRAAGCHRPCPARVRHPRRGPALPKRRCRPDGDRGIRTAHRARQLPGHLRG